MIGSVALLVMARGQSCQDATEGTVITAGSDNDATGGNDDISVTVIMLHPMTIVLLLRT